MRVQKFKGELKYTTHTVDDLILYEDKGTGTFRFAKDIYWVDGYEYSAETYDIDEFESVEEYFEEIDESGDTNLAPDWIVKAQTAK